MLSVFPELFTYGILVPFLLRLALGGFFILQGLKRHKDDGTGWNSLWGDKKFGSVPVAAVLSRVQIVIGVFLIIGLFTQVAAILSLIFIWTEWFKRHKIAKPSFQELWVAIFATAISLSLLFLGAGFLAFDLPL